jgi:hypothetical protein
MLARENGGKQVLSAAISHFPKGFSRCKTDLSGRIVEGGLQLRDIIRGFSLS